MNDPLKPSACLAAAVVLFGIGCGEANAPQPAPHKSPQKNPETPLAPKSPSKKTENPPAPKTYPRADERKAMVAQQLAARDIRDVRVLEAMRKVPRHLFIPEDRRKEAYEDHPVPIGHRQTISQPYIVGFMSQALQLKPGDRVLEIGTGSGYQAAVLGELAKEVYSIEILEPLGKRSKALLGKLGYENIHVHIGDGYQGWPEHAPFDAIIVTAAPPKVPQPLLDQLKVGGRMIIPVGTVRQGLVLIQRTETGYQRQNVLPVAFVPMTGKAQKKPGKGKN